MFIFVHLKIPPSTILYMKSILYPFIVVISLAIGVSSCSKSDKEPEEGNKYRDKSFTSPDGPVWQAAIQPDGKILVTGNLFNQGSQNITVLARLSKDGLIDATFNAHKDKWNYHAVNTLSLLNGGKVLIGGRLEVDGNQVPFLCFNADGSLDKSFVAPAGINEPYSATTAPDGNIFMTGAYREASGIRKQFVIRLNADGKQEGQMQVGDEFAHLSHAIPLADGKVLVMGDFIIYGGTQSKRSILRLNADLTIDPSFTFNYYLNYVPNPPPVNFPRGIRSAAVQADGKIIVIGEFIGYSDPNNAGNEHGADGVLRLHTNGTIDGSFQSVNGSRGQATDVEVLEDNRILVTRLYAFDLAAEPTIIYTTTGARDTTFSLTDPQSTIYGVIKQSGKNYLIWGGFMPYGEGMWRVKM
jgi:uncharacterized delta-60 repeat protein